MFVCTSQVFLHFPASTVKSNPQSLLNIPHYLFSYLFILPAINHRLCFQFTGAMRTTTSNRI
ncbi:unnamed protein product [Meloidogyne enterolobii]|uniref:Uncharacterized protein n=1 Tax=Meloidogyne enterolobii TaxID=390850 RepID=A0ACB1AE10_MELEN